MSVLTKLDTAENFEKFLDANKEYEIFYFKFFSRFK